MKLAPAFAIAMALAACGGKKKDDAPAAKNKPPAGSGAVAAGSGSAAAGSGSVAAGSGAGSASTKPGKAAPKVEPIKLTPEQRKEYRAHLSKGRKLGGKKAWGEAVTEFQACLKIIPNDARASGELGWAAFQAGDYDTARKANTVAVQRAGDRNVKASSLYNLGRVAEATGDKEAAGRFYVDSLALRPNKTVSERLAALGKTAPAAGASSTEAPPCATPVADIDAACACLVKQPFDFMDEGAAPECNPIEAKQPDDLAIVQVDIDWGNAELFLLWKGPKGWVVISDLGYLYKGGAFGVSGEMELDGVEDRTIAGHRVVTLTMTEHHHDSDMGIDEEEDLDTTTKTVCVLDAGAPPRCPLSVPTRISYVRDRMGIMEDGELDEDSKALLTPGLPIKREVSLDLTIGDDGVAKVVLAKGSAGDDVKSVLGPHKLW